MFLKILCVLILLTSTLQTAVSESNMENKQFLNKKIYGIITNKKFHHKRAEAIRDIKGFKSGLTEDHLYRAMHSFFEKIKISLPMSDSFTISIPPSILDELNKEKFKKSYPQLDRQDIVDSLEVVNIMIANLEKVTNFEMFNYLVHSKKENFHKYDMTIYWLDYFLSKQEIDINCPDTGTSLMITAMWNNNLGVAKILLKNGYVPTESDLEVVKGLKENVLLDDYPHDGLGALKELESIEEEILSARTIKKKR